MTLLDRRGHHPGENKTTQQERGGDGNACIQSYLLAADIYASQAHLQRDKRESRVCMHAVFVHRIVGFECGFFSSMTFQGNYTCKIT